MKRLTGQSGLTSFGPSLFSLLNSGILLPLLVAPIGLLEIWRRNSRAVAAFDAQLAFSRHTDGDRSSAILARSLVACGAGHIGDFWRRPEPLRLPQLNSQFRETRVSMRLLWNGLDAQC